MGFSMSKIHEGTQTDFSEKSDSESDDSLIEEDFFDALTILEDLRAAEVDMPVNIELPDNNTQPRDLPNHALLSSTPSGRLPPQTDDLNLSSILEARSGGRGDSGFGTIRENEENTVNSLLDDNSEKENFRLCRPRRWETKKNLSRENEKLKRERTWQRENRTLLQSQLKEQENVVKKLKEDLQKAVEMISSLKHQDSEKGAFITWIEEKLTTVEAEKLRWAEKESEMKEQQRQQQTDKEETNAIITQLAQDLQDANDVVSTTKQEKSETLQWAEAKITALIEEKTQWEEYKSQARECKAKQETLLQQKEATIRQLEHDLQEKQNSIEAFEGRSKYIKYIEDKLSKLEADNMIREDNRTKYKEEQNLMLQQREGKILITQAPGGLRETQGLAEQIRKLTEENSRLCTQNQIAQNELTRLRQEVAQLREVSDHQRQRLDVVEAQRRFSRDQERAADTQQTQCAVLLARARTQIAALQQQLDAKDAQIKSLLGQAQRLRPEQQSPGWRNGV